MIAYKRSSSIEELNQIIHLQQKNIPISLHNGERASEGFVTVVHTLELLTRMNKVSPHIIAKDGDKVVGYALCMAKQFGSEIEVLVPMFQLINQTLPKNTSYMVMGQICIDKDYRKQGIFRGLYHCMKDYLKDGFDMLITEIDSLNSRSLSAHTAVGFKTLKQYHSGGQDWELVYWDWK